MSSVGAGGKTWSELGEGVHICAIYDSEAEQLQPLLPFFRSGLDNQEKCMYIYETEPPPQLHTEFVQERSNPEKPEKNHQMEILPYSEAYTKEGPFEPDTVINMFRRTLDDSLEQGYKGLRAAGDMNWVLSSGVPLEKYLEYETKLNTFFFDRKLIGICQFDSSRFPKDFLIEMILTHPYIILNGKLYQNRFFYTGPRLSSTELPKIPAEDYETVISLVTDEEPLIA